MKIHFTKKEYELLLEMIYMADWVLSAHYVGGENPDAKPHKELEQKIFAHAKDFGLGDAVDKSYSMDDLFLSREFLDKCKVMDKIEEFENATFWEELLERMARRDFIRAYGEEAILAMPLEERFEKEMAFHYKYDEEFGENGIENLMIAKWKTNA